MASPAEYIALGRTELNAKQLKTILDKLAYDELAAWVRFVPPTVFEGEEVTKKLQRWAAKPEKLTQIKQMAELLSEVLSTQDRFNRFADALPEQEADVLDILVYEARITLGQLRELYSIDPLVRNPEPNPSKTVRQGSRTRGYLWGYSENKPAIGYLPGGFRFFKHSQVYYLFNRPAWIPDEAVAVFHSKNHTVELYELLRQQLKNYYAPPEEARLAPGGEPASDLTIYRAETTALATLPTARALGKVGSIKLDSEKRPVKSQAELNRLRRSFRQTAPFFPETENSYLKNIQPLLTAALAVDLAGIKVEEPEEALRQWCSFRLDASQQKLMGLLPMILPYLNGLSNARDHADNEINATLLDQLRRLPVGTWFEAKPFVESVLFYQPDHRMFPFGYNQTLGIRRSKHTQPMDIQSYGENLVRYGMRTYVRGFLFLAATAGLVDLAYEQPPPEVIVGSDIDSPYDTLRQFRLTPLGAYALGVTDRFEPAALEHTTFIPDEDLLFVRVEGDDEIAEKLLALSFEKIGPRRYRLDDAKLLKNLTKKKQFEERAARVRGLIGRGERLPEVWEQHLAELADRFEALTPVKGINVYQLDANNAALKNLLLRDEELRRLHTRAEGFRILVASENATAFEQRLLVLGYVL